MDFDVDGARFLLHARLERNHIERPRGAGKIQERLATGIGYLMLHTLERMYTWETMQKVMSIYFARWKFKHPQPEDFFAVLDEVTGSAALPVARYVLASSSNRSRTMTDASVDAAGFEKSTCFRIASMVA